jgi:hypothetical protein
VSTKAREVLLIGGMPTKPAPEAEAKGDMAGLHELAMDATEVFEVVADKIGDLTHQIPDGDQAGWVAAVFKTLPGDPSVQVVGAVPLHDRTDWKLPLFALKKDLDPSKVTLGPYGFTESAKDSYAKFVALRDAGKIPAGTRFEVTLPTPMSGMLSFLEPWEVILPIAEDAMIKELEGIVAAIPAEDLTIQWDVAGEVAGEEYARHPGAASLPYLEKNPPSSFDVAVDSVVRVCDAVPEPVQLGIHLCYGNPDGMHVIEPADGTVLKDFCNAFADRIKRSIQYIHVPVPIARDDAEFFAPFADLKLDADTKFNLGLIHLKDGLEGAKRRMAAATPVIADYGVSTECGFTAVPYDKLDEILDLHREVATA